MLKEITYKKAPGGAVHGTAIDNHGFLHSFRFFDGEFFPIEECSYRGGFTTFSSGCMEVCYDLHYPYYDADAPRVGVGIVEYKTGYVQP